MQTLSSTPAFVLATDPVVDWPVTVHLPANGGTFADFRFTARIRVLSEAEFAALVPDAEAVAAGDEEAAKAALKKSRRDILADNARVLPQIVIGWGTDVRGPDGRPVPFSAELLAAQLTGAHGMALSAGLWRAVSEVRFGITPEQPGALEGNAVPAPAAGSSSPEAQAQTS